MNSGDAAHHALGLRQGPGPDRCAGPADDRAAPPRISVAINTRNEERRLPYALRSVRPWVDEIVVVDMESEDRTVDIARSFGAVVFSVPPMGYADPARAFALSKCTGDWILVLDADELVPPTLASRLRAIASGDVADVVMIPMWNYLLGAPLMATGWGPHQDVHPRFFRRGCVSASASIHAYLHVSRGARVVRLEASRELSIAHFNYVDITHFIEKLNRYTSIEAESRLARGEAGSAVSALLAGGREFLRRFLRQGGLRDGWRGYYLALLMAAYRVVTAAKIREMREVGGRDSVERAYLEEADRLLQEYERDQDA